MKHKRIAVAGFAASMLVGAGTGLVLNIPGGASATGAAVGATTLDDTTAPTDTTDTTDTTDSNDDSTTEDSTSDDSITDDMRRPGKGAGSSAALADLVTAGTITQEQSDAITSAITAAREAAAAADAGAAEDATRPDRRAAVTEALAELVTAGTITQEQSDAVIAAVGNGHGPGGHGPGGHGPGGHGPGDHGGPGRGGFGLGRGDLAETAAAALGITTDELTTELEAGKTIAEVATEQGIAVQTVIDAIVAGQTADITERVTDIVNGVTPAPPAPNTPPPAPPATAPDGSDDTTVTTTD